MYNLTPNLLIHDDFSPHYWHLHVHNLLFHPPLTSPIQSITKPDLFFLPNRWLIFHTFIHAIKAHFHGHDFSYGLFQ